MNAPVSLPAAPAPVAKMPPLSEETLAEAMQALGGIFEQLINEATTISALKSQHYAAKKRAEKRTSEYEKSKSHHDGFPSIKESQTASKVKAEKDLKTITDKVNEKQSLLTGLAVKAAEKLIPALVAQGGGTTERENLQQQRIDSLEKKIEKLANDQRTILEEQRKANQTLEEKRQALAKTVDEKHQALKNTVQAVQGQSSSTQHRLETDMAKVEKVVQEAKDSNQAVESLKMDLLKAKGDVARVSTDNTQLSSSLKAQGQQVEALNARIKEIDAIQTELKGIATVPKAARDTEVQIDSLNDRFSKMKDQNSGLVSHITELAIAQKQFRENSALLQRRVEDIEQQPNPATFDTRLQKLENPRDVRDPGTKKDLDALEGRVRQLERTPPAQHPLPTKFSSEALDARVEALEKAGNRRTALEANVDQRLTGLEVDIANLRSADFDDVKKRIIEVETQQRRASAVTASNSQATPATAANIQPQLDTLREQIDELKEWQQVHDTTWTGVLNEQIEEESKKLQTRISSLEAKSSQLSSSLEERPQVAFDEVQKIYIIQSAAETVVAKFRTKPDLLPFNVDKTLNIVNQALVPMHTSIEATNLSLGNLQWRVDNINTLEVSKHALGQLYELHPDLQKIEALMVGFKADLAGYKTDMQAKTVQIEELREKMNALQGIVRNLEAMQDQKTAEAMTRHYHELRKEVESLTDGGIDISKKVTTVATELEKIVKKVSDFRNEYNDNLQVSANKFGQLQNDLDEKMDKSKEARRPSPAVSHKSNGTGLGPRPSSSSIGNRQPSVSSVNSNKKRKLDNPTSAKTNGVRPGSSASRSPQAHKRQRKHFAEDDPEADPDYNEEIPEPGVSDDEE
jgi:DNA repair exonuclease SbcCD ATPase subunit